MIRQGDTFELDADSPNRGKWIVHRANEARVWMEKALAHKLAPGDEIYGGIVQAMTLGLRENTPADIEDLFRISGTTHIFAVSGLHVRNCRRFSVGNSASCWSSEKVGSLDRDSRCSFLCNHHRPASLRR